MAGDSTAEATAATHQQQRQATTHRFESRQQRRLSSGAGKDHGGRLDGGGDWYHGTLRAQTQTRIHDVQFSVRNSFQSEYSF